MKWSLPAIFGLNVTMGIDIMTGDRELEEQIENDLKELEKKGLVKSVVYESGERYWSLTEEGNKLVESMRKEMTN